ncbi:glycoside hydrolase family 10 protein [Sphaerobolus stellatus SS14]|uniref:Glycoside hydrolase family 10 protein n=1 Tax=Sphaerobolus stellatus (strain SS14) TaxID=990650 RepID=A0A0C9UM12_SPHS4|nr:glycoside hydrolase family 10 protein [Sphaerobolus stellatus SS14]
MQPLDTDIRRCSSPHSHEKCDLRYPRNAAKNVRPEEQAASKQPSPSSPPSTSTSTSLTERDIAGALANDYVAIVKACLAVSKCVSITSWDVYDMNSWRTSSTLLLFYRKYNAKAAYNSVISALG